MTQTFTANDVVRYLYHDLPDKDHQWVSSLIATDEEYSRLYQDMQRAKELLDQVCMEPSEESIEKILTFSRHYHACKI